MEKRKMIKKQVLSNPRHGWCDFHLEDEKTDFSASLSYLTDVMYDTLKMCLTYLQTGAAAVMYDREGDGTFIFVLSYYDVYILDENMPGGMFHSTSISAEDICENILSCYYADTISWINFANMNDQSEKEYEKYEKKEGAEIHVMIKEIRKLLNKKADKQSIWTEIRCDFFDEEEQAWLVDAWKTGDDNEEGEVIAKISKYGSVYYVNDNAKQDVYAQAIINEKLKEM